MAPRPAPGEEQLVGHRAEDGAELHLAAGDERHRDAKACHAADEVRRAVDRVDHPYLVTDLAALFLAEELILGKGFGQAARQQPLDRSIGFAGVVLGTLEGDLQRVPAIEPVQRQLPGLDRHGPENLLAPVKLGLFGYLWHSAPFRDVHRPTERRGGSLALRRLVRSVQARNRGACLFQFREQGLPCSQPLPPPMSSS